MPLYEYECDACAHRFEVIQKFSDAPVETCPACGGSVSKLLSSPAFQFKGTGWYVTDYPKKGQATAAKAEGSASSQDSKDKSKDKDTTSPASASSSSHTSAPAVTPAGSTSKQS